MSEELVLETQDKKRFAPPANEGLPVKEEDLALQKEFAKIPDKMAFKIGEVARLVGVKAYVLRYWESEFSQLKPQKSRHNQRVYLRKDVELLMMIKKLLYKDRFSIEGARAALGKQKKEVKKVTAITGVATQVEDLRNQVQDLIMSIRQAKQRLANP